MVTLADEVKQEAGASYVKEQLGHSAAQAPGA